MSIFYRFRKPHVPTVISFDSIPACDGQRDRHAACLTLAELSATIINSDSNKSRLSVRRPPSDRKHITQSLYVVKCSFLSTAEQQQQLQGDDVFICDDDDEDYDDDDDDVDDADADADALVICPSQTPNLSTRRSATSSRVRR